MSVYPSKPSPYPEKDQPYTYGSVGNTDGEIMPNTPDPSRGITERDSDPPDNNRSVG